MALQEFGGSHWIPTDWLEVAGKPDRVDQDTRAQPFNPFSDVAHYRLDPSRTDRIAALRQEMRELGAGMLDDALSSAEALVQKLRELAEAPSDAVSDGQRDAAGKLAADLDSRVTTMRQIQGRRP